MNTPAPAVELFSSMVASTLSRKDAEVLVDYAIQRTIPYVSWLVWHRGYRLDTLSTGGRQQ